MALSVVLAASRLVGMGPRAFLAGEMLLALARITLVGIVLGFLVRGVLGAASLGWSLS